MIRTILGISLTLIVYSCVQKPSKKVDHTNKRTELSSLLMIENRINRGARYTNSDSINYWLVHIASTIRNNSTIPIQLKMDFLEEYNYPSEYGNQTFKILLLPKVFALDEVTKVTDNAIYTDSMQAEILNYIEDRMDQPYRFNKTIEPGEYCTLPIGTYFPESFSCLVFPNMLVSQSELSNFQTCENLLIDNESNETQLSLGLKLDFRSEKNIEKCSIIQCGQISIATE